MGCSVLLMDNAAAVGCVLDCLLLQAPGGANVPDGTLMREDRPLTLSRPQQGINVVNAAGGHLMNAMALIPHLLPSRRCTSHASRVAKLETSAH